MSASFSSFPGFGDAPASDASSSTHKASKRLETEVVRDAQSGKRKKDRRDRDERSRKPSRERTRSPSRAPRTYDEDERKHDKLHAKRPDHEERGSDATPTFFIDRRGDPLNLQYGRPHSGDIPKYRHVGGKRILLSCLYSEQTQDM
jgi:hypothetical protein